MTTSNFFTAFYSALADARTYYELQKEMNVKTLESVYLNLFNGKTDFQAVVLSVLPNSDNTQTKEQSIRVRPLDIHNLILPEPCTVKCPGARKALISLHPVAYSAQVPTSISSDDDGSAKISPMSIRTGDVVTCRFSDGPANNGKMRGLTFEPMTRGSLPQSNMNLRCLREVSVLGSAAMFGGGGATPMAEFVGPMPSQGDVTDQHAGKLVRKSGSGFIIVSWADGVTPKGFWPNFRKELNEFVNREYSDLGLKIANLGVGRDLESSADTKNPDRTSGSKHGAGLANDLYLHTTKYGKYTSYKKMNPILAKDKKLIQVLRKFSNLNPNLQWGGNFNGGSGLEIKSRGITEFHHWEIRSNLMPQYFKKWSKEIQESGYGSYKNITSERELAKLYRSLYKKQKG